MKRKIIIILLTSVLLCCLLLIVLYKTGICRFEFAKRAYKKATFAMNTNELTIPEDALSFSVYDMGEDEYLYYEGESQFPTIASLTKLFVIDYALTKVNPEDIVHVNRELLETVPAGSSLANLQAGEYTVKQIMQGMLVPSGNDAAYALAYHIAEKELGEGYTTQEYIEHFTNTLNEYLAQEGYERTHLYDPSGFSTQADTHLDDVNRVTLKLLDYDFVKECIGQSYFSIETPQGEFTWKNTNVFLDKKAAYYNQNIKGVKTGTMASSYSIIALYEENGKQYLITCLASPSDADRYEAVQSAINTIIK